MIIIKTRNEYHLRARPIWIQTFVLYIVKGYPVDPQSDCTTNSFHASLSLCVMLISGVLIGILVSSLMVRFILFPRLIIVVVILIVCLIVYLTPIPLSSALKQHPFPTFIAKITGASMPSPVSALP